MRSTVPLESNARRADDSGMREMQCPYCRSRITTRGILDPGLRLEYRTGGLVIYAAGEPVHSCDLERAHRAERRS